MTYFEGVADWVPEKRQALLDWMENEGLDAADIVDDGRFSVHNGRISGWRFITNEHGRIVNRRSRSFLKVPFNVAQKHPLPEGL
jgi:hypothetical protein